MKKNLVFALGFIMLMFLLSCSKDNVTNPETPQYVYMTEHKPQGFYEIDVKTNLWDKLNETGTKNGTICYINNSDWGKKVEIGEDYSLWIKDLSRTPEDSLIHVSINLELQEPSLLLEGYVYKKKHFEITYTKNQYDETTKGNATDALIAQRFQDYANRCKKAGQIAAFVNNSFISNSPHPYTKLASKIISMLLDMFMDEELWYYQQIEAVIIGSEMYGQLKEWLWELEQ